MGQGKRGTVSTRGEERKGGKIGQEISLKYEFVLFQRKRYASV